MKYITNFCRIIVGITFIISGIVKTIDPIGFSYKLEEYFSESVLNLPFLEPYSLPFSVLFVVLEVILGVFLLLGIFKKLTLYSLLGLIIFFAFLTFYAAYFDKVKDCGCFGDFIKLKPWQTFYKDIALLVLILIILINEKYLHPIYSNIKFLNFLGLISTIITLYIAYRGIFHLPIYDFRPYAEGKNLIHDRKSAQEIGLKPPVLSTIYTINNIQTKEQKIMDDKEYVDSGIWQDSIWVIDSKQTKTIEKEPGYTPPVPPDFAIECSNEDKTDEILNYDSVILITIPVTKKVTLQELAQTRKFASSLNKLHIKYVIIGDENSLHGMQLCTLDEKVIKAINRSHVGIMILKKGIVIKKYHYNDFPDITEIKKYIK